MTNTIVGRHRARIGAAQRDKGDGASLNMHVLGPGSPAVQEWAALGLRLPQLDVIRPYRLNRLRQMLHRFDYAGIVLFDPVNIRYATDSTNMQVWIAHNANRYCFVAAGGPVILFDYEGVDYLSEHVDLIDEIRPATAWYYMMAGARYAEKAQEWAAEIVELVRRHGGGNTRLAIDRVNPEGVHALQNAGVSIHNGEEIMELTRVIKHPEEIVAMRCAIAACEKAMDVMKSQLEPGITENRLWSVLHAENIARGGEWIETRLLASGPRTNPWFQECSSRVIEAGDLVAFDTDLIGPYGVCVDISRTWLCGERPSTAYQREIYQLAHAQIQANTALLKPGVTFRELTETALAHDSNRYNHYSVLYHGVGLADEYPTIYFPQDWAATGYDGVLEENMVLCVESYVGAKNGREGVKLEDQVWITAAGPIVLSTYPYEEALLR